MTSGNTSIDDTVEAVHAWNPHKRRLMRPAHIHVAFERLRDRGWLAPPATA